MRVAANNLPPSEGLPGPWYTLAQLALMHDITAEGFRARAATRCIGHVNAHGVRVIHESEVPALLERHDTIENQQRIGTVCRAATLVCQQDERAARDAAWRRIALTLGAAAYELTGVPFSAIEARNRQPHVIDAFRLIIGALASYGAGASAISRALARDHSTIIHHLKYLGLMEGYTIACPRASGKTYDTIWDNIYLLMQMSACDVELSPEGLAAQHLPVSAIGPWMRSRLPEPIATATCAYVQHMLLATTQRASGPAIANGIWYVATRPDVRHIVISALARTGQSLYEPHLRYHAARYGYAWVEAPVRGAVA